MTLDMLEVKWYQKTMQKIHTPTPIYGALICIVTTLIIVAVVIVFIVRARERDDCTAHAQRVVQLKNIGLYFQISPF